MRTSSLFGAVALVVAVTVAACASSGMRNDRVSSNRITRAEISDGQFQDGLSAVRRLRPQWLRTSRAPTSFRDTIQDVQGNIMPGPSRIQVWMDNSRIGVLDDLGRIRAEDIEEIEWISGSQAAVRFGTGTEEGVILVSSRRP